MRNFFFIILFLISEMANAQVQKIKIKKEDNLKKPQVSLCGKINGEISLTALCSDNKFRISNNNNYKVHFAIASFKTEQNNLVEWVISTDSLNPRIIKHLLRPETPPKTKMTISEIKAKNQKGDEIRLNDIIVMIIK